MSIKARWMDNKVRVIANKNTIQDEIKTTCKATRREKKSRERWVTHNSQAGLKERGGFQRITSR
jgi:thermostable 8-oxoguanine DNA glycosylase